jgi:predicted Zn-dependent protease
LSSPLPPEPGATARLLRWRAFPLTYSVDTSALPPHVQQLYADAALRARDGWSQATGTVIGQLKNAGPGAQITVRIVESGGLGSVGRTTMETYRDFITRATILLQRHAQDEGRPHSAVGQVTNQLTHEIGHALGIVMHSPDRGDLMHPSGNFSPESGNDPASSFITAADRNALLHAYCH